MNENLFNETDSDNESVPTTYTNKSRAKSKPQPKSKDKTIKERKTIDKKVSAKKSRIKSKLYRFVDDFSQYKVEKLPAYLDFLLKNKEYLVGDVDSSLQNSCAEFFINNNKYKILLILLQNIENESQLTFFKNIFLNKKYLEQFYY